MCRHNPRPGVKKTLAEICKFLIKLDNKVDKYMSETQDKLDALATSLGGVSDALATAAAGLASDIADLKQQVADGLAVDFSAVDARVEALKASSDALSALDAENPVPEPEQPQG